jgi:hypothetical protein
MDRSPMEIIGRPKRLPPALRAKRHKKTVALCGELRFRATPTGHGSVEGKPVVMRSRETVTTWSQDREAGRCQVNGSHLMSRALHHLLDAEFPPQGHMDWRPCRPWGERPISAGLSEDEKMKQKEEAAGRQLAS